MILCRGLTNLDRLKAISGLHDWSDVGFGALMGGGRGEGRRLKRDERRSADKSVKWSKGVKGGRVNRTGHRLDRAFYLNHCHNILMAL